jgi:hypothetical protein
VGGNDLSAKVIAVTQEYLGPASERFIYRLINFHLGKEPSELSKKDLAKLTEWVKVSLGLLTDDKSLVKECEKKLLKLAA